MARTNYKPQPTAKIVQAARVGGQPKANPKYRDRLVATRVVAWNKT